MEEFPLQTTGNPSRVVLKQEFLKPFDEEEVLGQFRSRVTSKDSDEIIKIYSKNFGKFEYRISEKNNQDEIFFDLSSDPSKLSETQMVFRKIDSKTNGTGYNIIHRIVKTQEEGVSGSSFLKKAEEYISILKKNKLIACEWLGLESAQSNVTDFFLKNGFSFSKEGSESYGDYLKNKENYETLISDFLDNTDIKDRSPIIVLKEAFQDPEFLKYVKDRDGIRVFECGFEEARKFIGKYIPTAVLVKYLDK